MKSKFNIGDRIIHTLTNSKGEIVEKHDILSNINNYRILNTIYSVKFVGSDILMEFSQNVIELDKEYYRDQKINEILK